MCVAWRKEELAIACLEMTIGGDVRTGAFSLPLAARAAQRGGAIGALTFAQHLAYLRNISQCGVSDLIIWAMRREMARRCFPTVRVKPSFGTTPIRPSRLVTSPSSRGTSQYTRRLKTTRRRHARSATCTPKTFNATTTLRHCLA